MGIRDFARSLKPGSDAQLATDLSARRRAGHRRSIPGTAAKGQEWEDRDRDRDRSGRDIDTDWDQ